MKTSKAQALGLAVALGLWLSGPGLSGGAAAHEEPRGQGAGGPGMMMGQGMRGQGMRGRDMRGHEDPGFMGRHMMDQYPMGRHMMGHGDMGRHMMAPGSRGHGFWGQGSLGPRHGWPIPAARDLTADDVRERLDRQLAWLGNPRLKLGTVSETDEDKIIAEIVTQDGSLVQRLEVDRHSGALRQVQ